LQFPLLSLKEHYQIFLWRVVISAKQGRNEENHVA